MQLLYITIAALIVLPDSVHGFWWWKRQASPVTGYCVTGFGPDSVRPVPTRYTTIHSQSTITRRTTTTPTVVLPTSTTTTTTGTTVTTTSTQIWTNPANTMTVTDTATATSTFTDAPVTTTTTVTSTSYTTRIVTSTSIVPPPPFFTAIRDTLPGAKYYPPPGFAKRDADAKVTPAGELEARDTTTPPSYPTTVLCKSYWITTYTITSTSTASPVTSTPISTVTDTDTITNTVTSTSTYQPPDVSTTSTTTTTSTVTTTPTITATITTTTTITSTTTSTSTTYRACATRNIADAIDDRFFDYGIEPQGLTLIQSGSTNPYDCCVDCITDPNCARSLFNVDIGGDGNKICGKYVLNGATCTVRNPCIYSLGGSGKAPTAYRIFSNGPVGRNVPAN